MWRHWLGRRRGEPMTILRRRYERFEQLIEGNNRVLDLIADAGEKSGGDHLFDRRYVEWLVGELEQAVSGVVYDLNAIAGGRYGDLVAAAERICHAMRSAISPSAPTEWPLVLPLAQLDRDAAGAVGAKLATLGEVRRRLELTVPDGFVLSATACRRFFRGAGIDRVVSASARELAEPDGPAFEAAATRVRDFVRRAPLDPAVARALQAELRSRERAGWRYAVRSSALDEDGEHSFAGLHVTLLNVTPERAPDAYREVVASLFATAALRYRAEHRMPVSEALMAVGFLAMVPARSSGVVHTVTAAAPERDVMAVSAAWGLGPTVVAGSGPTDSFELSRDPEPRVQSRRIADKALAVRPRAGDGVAPQPVPAAERTTPCLVDHDLVRLGRVGLAIERHAGQRQEIEWAMRAAGAQVIVQARVLRVTSTRRVDRAQFARVLGEHRVLSRAAGVIACGGVGAGPVVVARGGEAPAEFPFGGVLVAHSTSPRLAALLGRASAVVTSVGTTTGHLATVAREYRVPMLVGVAEATTLLADVREVTVDAEENVIYDGVVHELVRDYLARRHADTDFAEFRLLRRLLRQIAPLNLSDPEAETFRARSCATCHDVVRFAHEMAVRELVSMPGLTAADRRRFLRRVRLPIPLDLDVLDLGGGLAAGVDGAFVATEMVRSAPLAAMLKPLCASWRTDPVDVDMTSFLASATRPLTVTEAKQVRPNLAVITNDYLSLHLMLGYHFNLVDCRLTDDPGANYLYFRFHGGVTEITRRSRRARAIAAILEAHGFGVETRGDLVVGRLRTIPAPALRDVLAMVGRLVGYTRQLDVLMRDEGTVEEFTRDFCEREPA